MGKYMIQFEGRSVYPAKRKSALDFGFIASRVINRHLDYAWAIANEIVKLLKHIQEYHH